MTNFINLKLGDCYITDGAKEVVNYNEMLGMLYRHANGDWGDDICEEAVKLNNKAAKNGGNVMSMYFTNDNIEVRVLTLAKKKETLVLLANEFGNLKIVNKT